MAPISQSRRADAHRECLRRYAQDLDSSRFIGAQHFGWQDGEVAFLKLSNQFDDHDWNCLINSGYLPKGATGHPVIILSRRSSSSTHVAVTTVSAYSSGKFNNYLAPWKQDFHYRKSRHSFRSFQGSERADGSRQLLYLEGKKMMPKPKASWVYIQSVYVVPITTLTLFDKAPTRLRMTKESLVDLRSHIAAENRAITHVLKDPRLDETVSHMPIDTPPFYHTQKSLASP